MMLKYEELTQRLSDKILFDRRNGNIPPVAFEDSDAVRRNNDRDKPTIIRTPFIRDVDKILHCPFYSRYADKTQVLSFYKNDDITRRALHVQFVSRIARTIGQALGLNCNLIEAIALGHDIGHTPFGHAGEYCLDEIFCEKTGLHFAHNIHSVRVLDKIFQLNLTLQTLDGIAAHDGELELSEYRPVSTYDFDTFDLQVQSCYKDKSNIKKLVPMTLEGCVVRISDIIAYLGKDRQDAQRARIINNANFESGAIGSYNAEIINNLVVNIVENSYGKSYIKMDEEHFFALSKAKSDNYKYIYKTERVSSEYKKNVEPMMHKLYEKLLNDLNSYNTSSPIFTHHVNYINSSYYIRRDKYEETEPNQIVVDYIASMTDDYFIDLYAYLFGDNTHTVDYRGYFE